MAFIVFVFDAGDNNWKEANELFPNDIALLLDRDKKNAYFWAGDLAREKDKDIALNEVKKLMEKYSLYKFIVLGPSTIPLYVQAEIERLMGDNANYFKQKVIRTRSMQVAMIAAGLSLIMMFAVLINHLRMLGWDDVSYYRTDQTGLYSLFNASIIMMIILLGIICVEFIAASISKRIFLVTTALASFMIALGTFYYVAQGELLFNYSPNFSRGIYEIERGSLHVHLLWMFVAFLGLVAINGYAIYVVIKQSELPAREEVDISELDKKSRPTILRDKERKIEKIAPPTK